LNTNFRWKGSYPPTTVQPGTARPRPVSTDTDDVRRTTGLCARTSPVLCSNQLDLKAHVSKTRNRSRPRPISLTWFMLTTLPFSSNPLQMLSPACRVSVRQPVHLVSEFLGQKPSFKTLAPGPNLLQYLSMATK